MVLSKDDFMSKVFLPLSANDLGYLSCRMPLREIYSAKAYWPYGINERKGYLASEVRPQCGGGWNILYCHAFMTRKVHRIFYRLDLKKEMVALKSSPWKMGYLDFRKSSSLLRWWK